MQFCYSEYFLQNGYTYFVIFQDSFWKEALTEQKVMHLPTIYESVFLIALSSYAAGTGDEGFRKQVYERLRRPPFHSSISAEEQV